MNGDAQDPEATHTLRLGSGAAPSSTGIPDSIGGYRVLSKLGEGGMGVVYEAEQRNPKRRVAVKIVRGGQFVDERRVRMFQREADALARLKHPNIGAIYESGRTEDGQHFFAMELVRGETLDDHLETRHEAFTALEVRYRLGLFRKIANAVHYAHQRGVIHRDLKPSNIVVTNEAAPDDTEEGTSLPGPPVPEVKVLDFGLARITDSDVVAATTATEVGVIKGTLPYMSPEQARGDPADIDVRTDVYALGVILYEMLSGQQPYDVGARHLVEAVRIICEEPPRPLRSILRGSQRPDVDLETIVAKALEKDADGRYVSAAAFAEDVSRYLSSQPILARRPSTTYVLRKFAARNRALVGGVAATFVVLLAGVVVSTLLGLSEAAQRREAVRARNDLQTVVDFQSQMLRSVDPPQMGQRLLEDLRRRMAAEAGRSGGSTQRIEADMQSLGGYLARLNPADLALRVIDEDILSRAARSVDERFGAQPLVEAQLRHSLAETYLQLGLLDRAEPQALRAREIRERELGREHPDTLQSGYTIAFLYERQGRFRDSERVLQEVLDLARRALGDEHHLTLLALNRLGIAYDLQDRFDEAEQAYRKVYEARRHALGEDDPETIWALHNLGSLLRKRGRAADGAPLLSQALADFRRTLGDTHRHTLWAMESMAFAHQDQGQLAEAGALARESLEGRRRLLGEDHHETLGPMTLLAGIERDQGRLESAEALFRDSLDRAQRTLGRGHRLTIWTLEGLAKTMEKQGRPEEARQLHQEAKAER